MYKRDLVKDQIEQLGKVLAKMLDNFFSLKSKGNIASGTQMAYEIMQEELELEPAFLLGASDGDLKTFFEEKNFTAQHLEDLALLLVEIAESKLSADRDEASKLLQRASDLLSIKLDTEDQTIEMMASSTGFISFDQKRSDLKSRIEQLLEKCS